MLKNNPLTLIDYLKESTEKFPSKHGIIFGKDKLSYEHLESLSDKLAAYFIMKYVKRHDRILIYLDTCGEIVTSFIAIQKVGGIFVIINSLVKPEKLSYIISDCGCKIIITGRNKIADVKSALSILNQQIEIICIDDCEDPELNVVSFSEITSSNISYQKLSERKSQIVDIDIAALIYTSGSTGEPKGVMIPHANMISVSKIIMEYLWNSYEDKILSLLPLSFGYGLYQVIPSLIYGGTVYLENTLLFPKNIFDKIREEEITGLPLVPTIYALLFKDKNPGELKFPSLRYITNAGAALSTERLLHLQSLFTNTKIFSMHGLTECTRTAFLPPEDVLKKPASVGKAIRNCELKIINENGVEVETGEIGELVVKGSNVMRGYWNDKNLTDKKFEKKVNGDVWLHSDDLFKKDEEGYFYFVSRMDDIIKTKGEKVSPKEVENIIYEMEGVIDCAVVGVPDEILGNSIKAFVVMKDGFELNEKNIQKKCSEKLEPFMVPKYIEFLSELPKNINGKIDKKSLKNISRITEQK
jgi:long-chain acyl-CoA synthetase